MAEYKNIMVYVETAEENPVKVGLEMLHQPKNMLRKSQRLLSEAV